MSIFDEIKRLFGAKPVNEDGAGDEPGPGGPAMDDVEMIPCEQALRLVHDYIDGELDGVSHVEVKRHFEACSRCYPHLQLESAYREAVRRAAEGQCAPPELKAKVGELLREARSEE